MKSVRWRVILVTVVLLVTLFEIFPTIRWATLTTERQKELSGKWENVREQQQDDIRYWQLSEKARNELINEREAKGDRIPGKPSLIRNMLTGLKMWWQGDPDQILPLGLDLKGGIRVELQTDADHVDAVFETINRRIDQFGVREPDIRKVGARGISIELPGATDIERVRRLIEEQAFMQWILVAEDYMTSGQYPDERLLSIYDEAVRYLEQKYEGELDEYGNPVRWTFNELDKKLHEDQSIPENTILRVWDSKERDSVRVTRTPLLLRSTPEDPEVVRGDDLRPDSIRRERDEQMQNYITFDMISRGARRFQQITRTYHQGSDNAIAEGFGRKRGWRIAILIDNKVISSPAIQSEIAGSGRITGDFTDAEADNLVIQLRSGSLPAKPTITSIIQVGPRLGMDSIVRGVRAALLGLILVVIFIGIYYLKCGLVAITALVLNILIILAALAALGATLTLPGIAGIILTIGMAVDANVLIFERMREEFASAKKVRAAISSGYDKAFRTILDSNLTTLVTALILYTFGTGPVKGFAVTLSIGIAASMFTALFVTRLIFEILMRKRAFEDIRMLQFFKQPNFDFAKHAKTMIIVSIVVIVIGMTSFSLRLDRMMGIDFAGGTVLDMEFENKVNVADVRRVVRNDLGISDAQVRLIDQEGGTSNKISVHTRQDVSETIPREISEKIGIELMRDGVSTIKVGPAHAAGLWRKAIIAVILAFIGIIIYVSFRFEFVFGIAAVVALIHDVLITLGFFSGMFLLPAREINLPIVAALLTIVGYSINDTIVIFDRVREDLKIMKRLDFRTIINMSINQTMSRTILTSGTTLLVILSLLFLGGQAVSDFAFAMLIGVITGTYSTIFIANPILLYMQKKRA